MVPIAVCNGTLDPPKDDVHACQRTLAECYWHVCRLHAVDGIYINQTYSISLCLVHINMIYSGVAMHGIHS